MSISAILWLCSLALLIRIPLTLLLIFLMFPRLFGKVILLKSVNSVKSLIAALIIKLINVGLVWLFNRFDFVIDFDKIGCPFCSFYSDNEVK